MDLPAFFNSEIFTWVILPILIFLSRICDVTFGTIRIILVARGNKRLAPILGFFEVLIWLVAISQIMKNLNNFVCYIAYPAGFAAGNYVGIRLEEKLAMGILALQVITTKNTCDLAEKLSEAGYGSTSVDAHGAREKVKLVYIVVKRKQLMGVLRIVRKCDPKAFYSIQDARMAGNLGPSLIQPGSRSHPFSLLRLHRLFESNREKK